MSNTYQRTLRDGMEAALRPYFNLTSAGENWEVLCEVCNQTWLIRKTPVQPHNLETLMEHARRCGNDGHYTEQPA